ncbi:hypothetical protein [Massilia aerilata]|uniref:Uncharacterized protein n=1 Tax=Massilia aerilata TaxID=453817 RepID=A0ABW0RQA1_9BURK
MKTQLLQDFNDSRADHAGPPRPGAGARTEPPAAPPATAASAAPAELEATVVPAEALPPAPAAPAKAAASPSASTTPPPASTTPPPPATSVSRPVARPRPAVWQRPQQQADADATVKFPPPMMPASPPLESPLESPPVQAQAQVQVPDGAQATTPLPGRARGFAPQPTASGLTPPLSDTTVREWPQGAPAGGGDPDWLTERLARDVAVHDSGEWNGRWKTRLLSWGAAGVLLALVAGGGFWLYEQSRVEGALVVVANTNPSPEANVPGTGRAAEAPPAPKSAAAANADNSAAILAPVSALPPSALPAARPAGPGAIDTSPFSITDRTVKPVALGDEPAVPPKRPRSKERKQARPQQEARARVQDTEPSARQRREETLLQCRAHGYDERQCLRRGCEMTRYGFACRG